jgi:hypothetical protein
MTEEGFLGTIPANRVVLLHDGMGGLANQLRVAACVLAFALYSKRECVLPCFFRFRHYFKNAPAVGMADWIRHVPVSQLWKKRGYRLLARAVGGLPLGVMLAVDELTFLPPTEPRNSRDVTVQAAIQAAQGKDIYLSGWLLRNPDGLITYRAAILEAFQPADEYLAPARAVIAKLRRDEAFVVGVHWRQGDYATWEGGKHLISERRLLKCIAAVKKKTARDFPGRPIRFLICTDGPQPRNIPPEYEFVRGPDTEIGDLYGLSMTDWILGSHSTYGRWASFYGQVPITIMTESGLDCALPQELG